MERNRGLYEEVTTYGEGSSASVEEEIRQLDDLLEKNPDHLDVTEWLAFKLYSTGRYERAVQLYKRLIAKGHRPGVQYFYLGNTYFKMHDERRAAQSWGQTIALIPNDAKAQKAQARLERLNLEESI